MAQYQLVRFKTGKITLELMTYPGSCAKYRKQQLGRDNVLVSDVIWKNQAKGDRANDSDLVTAFNTDKTDDCIEQILQNGEIQISAAEKREKIEQRRREIINYIHKYYIDPKTKTSIPVVRIESALYELKFRVDAEESVVNQVQDIMKRLPEIIPIKKSEITGTLRVPHAHVGAATAIVQKYTQVNRENYDADGSVMDVSLVPGDFDAFVAELNRVTRGEATFEIEGAAQFAATTDEAAPKSGKAARGGKAKRR